MAIDTAEKRRSAAGIAFHPLGPGVTPNSAKDADWRKQVGWGYSRGALEVRRTLGYATYVPSSPGTATVLAAAAGEAAFADSAEGDATLLLSSPGTGTTVPSANGRATN